MSHRTVEGLPDLPRDLSWEFCSSCLPWVWHSEPGSAYLVLRRIWKGPRFCCPELHFPEASSVQIYFLQKFACCVQLAVSSGFRRYGVWSVKEAPLSPFSSVWSRPHLGLDFSGVKVGKDLGTVTRRDGPAWASSSWRQSEKGGVPLGDECGRFLRWNLG